MTRALYIDRHGTKVGYRDGQLHLESPGAEDQPIPIHLIEFVVICSHAHFSHDALRALLINHIPTVFSAHNGGFLGSLSGLPGNQVHRRMAQYDMVRDPSRQMQISKALIHAKLRGQARLLHHWQVPSSEELSHALHALANCSDLNILRGHEGIGARGYFRGLQAHLRDTPFVFPGRRQHPSTDPINAVLSLGYTLLQGEMDVGVAVAGLDRCAGFCIHLKRRAPHCSST